MGHLPYGHGVYNAVNNAADAGIVWVNAAGNQGQNYWYGEFNDTDDDGFHNFSDDANCNEMELESGKVIRLQMRWEDSWENATRDVDLLLLRPAPAGSPYKYTYEGAITSENRQGTDQFGTTDKPLEKISWVPDTTATYCLLVRHYAGEVPAWIQLQEQWKQPLEFWTNYGTLISPADSANPALLAVGAANWETPDILEGYSARGPSPDGRTKPDIVGVVNTYSEVGGGNWVGTSASSPHIAGLAALVRQVFPEKSAIETATYLKRNAIPRGDTVPNNDWGYGLGRLPSTDATAPPSPTPDPSPSPVPTETPSPLPAPDPTHCLEEIDIPPTGLALAILGNWDANDGCKSIDHPPSEFGAGADARYYAFELSSSVQMTLSLTSTVNAYLYIRKGRGTDGEVLFTGYEGLRLVGAENRTKRLSEKIEPGIFTIEISTYESALGEDFQLQVEVTPTETVTPPPTPTPLPTPSPTPEPTPCIVGIRFPDGITSTHQGEWQAGECQSFNRPIDSADTATYARYYTVQLNHSIEMSITLSSDLDTYLYVLEGEGVDGRVLYENDDYQPGVNSDSQIVELMEPGTYTIEATTYAPDVIGQFVLSFVITPEDGRQPPPPTPAPPSGRFIDVSRGYDHACGLRDDGRIQCWGAGDEGQATPPDGEFVSVSSDYKGSCAVRADNGQVVCWGSLVVNNSVEE